MPRTARPAQRRVAAVTRAVSVLDVLAEAGDELGTNEIARRTGINASTVSRMLATLAEAGMVEYVEENGRYRLGLRLVHLGNIVLDRLDLREIARPHLRELVDSTQETATLSAPSERNAITLDFVQSPSSVQGIAEVGRPSVGHATATGKVMLAFGRAAPRSEPLQAYTRRTITSRRALAAELERVRAQGWAQSVGEREPDLNAIAAPLWNSGGELVAILGVQGPASRFDAKAMRAALEPLRASATAISHALGWH